LTEVLGWELKHVDISPRRTYRLTFV